MRIAAITAWARNGRLETSRSNERPSNVITPLRLALAVLVAFSHAFPLSGTPEPITALSQGRQSFGELAVIGFFALSGMLITASGQRLSPKRFLWHRFLRIYPAYWACLVVTAIAVVALGPATLQDALRYVSANASILVSRMSVAGEPVGTPHPHTLNGAIWTLAPEVACYLAVVLLGRRRWISVAAFVVLQALLLLKVGYANRLELGLAFAAGAVIYHFRIPTGRLMMTAASLALVAALVSRRAEHLAVPAIAILVIGLGRLEGRWRLPDLSYGTYLYAFPVMQGFAALGIRGALPLFAATIAVVLPIAAASWYLLERPVLSLKSWRLRIPIRIRSQARVPAIAAID